MRTGRPFVAYLVLLDFTVFHSTRHGSEALAPEVQPFESHEYGRNKCKLFDRLTLNTLKGFSRFTITLFSYRSCRFWPTPGRLTTTGIPSFLSSAAGPIPLSLSSCGVLKVPPDIMTSFSAYAVPEHTISIPLLKDSREVSHTRYSSRRRASSCICPIQTLAVQKRYPNRSRTIWCKQDLGGQTVCSNVNLATDWILCTEKLSGIDEEVAGRAPFILVHVEGGVEKSLVGFVVRDSV